MTYKFRFDGIGTTKNIVRRRPSTSVPAFLTEDFSKYTDTANMFADPRNIYSTAEDLLTGQMSLGTDGGYGGSPNYMRYTYPDRTALSGSRCADYTIGRNIKFYSNGSTVINDVWVEISTRFSSGFSVKAPAGWSCQSGAGLKFIFGRIPVGPRYALGMDDTAWMVDWPPGGFDDRTNFVSSFNPFDGEWHTYRHHWKPSTTTTSADGIVKVWLDGVVCYSSTTLNIKNSSDGTVTGTYGLALARNINQGPDHVQTLDWGKIVVYNTDPGW